MPAKKAPDVPITIRFPATLRDDLKVAADADGRSFNAYVVRALQAHRDAHKTPKR